MLHEQKTTDQAKDKEETPPSVDKSQRQPIRGFIIGIVIPAFVVYLAYVLFPIVHHKNILGGRKDFSDCTVLQYDANSDSMLPTNETIEIA